jgi:hypothetical protein
VSDGEFTGAVQRLAVFADGDSGVDNLGVDRIGQEPAMLVQADCVLSGPGRLDELADGLRVGPGYGGHGRHQVAVAYEPLLDPRGIEAKFIPAKDHSPLGCPLLHLGVVVDRRRAGADRACANLAGDRLLTRRPHLLLTRRPRPDRPAGSRRDQLGAELDALTQGVFGVGLDLLCGLVQHRAVDCGGRRLLGLPL